MLDYKKLNEHLDEEYQGVRSMSICTIRQTKECSATWLAKR